MAKKIIDDMSNKTVEDLQLIINDLQKKNKQIEHDKVELITKNNSLDKSLKDALSKIKSLTSDKDVLKKELDNMMIENLNMAININSESYDIDLSGCDFKIGDVVTYQEKWANMPFEVTRVVGKNKDGDILFRIMSHMQGVYENFVPSKKLKKMII